MKNPDADAQLSVLFTDKGKGAVELLIDGALRITVTRVLGEEAEARVDRGDLTPLYFGYERDAHAYVAAGNSGHVSPLHDRFASVSWELPNGAYVPDLADVIDFAREPHPVPTFFGYYSP